MKLAALLLAASAPALAAVPTDPCLPVFTDIANSLEAGNAASAAAHFQAGSKGQAAVRAISNDPSGAKKLAATFRGARFKNSYDNGATYAASWEDPTGKVLNIDIGAEYGLFGCVVQSW